MDAVNELQVRLDKYVLVLRSAEEEGNASKIRRYKRIITQYQKAIKESQAGKPVALGELPNPPGFPPLVPDSLDVPEASDEVSPGPSPVPDVEIVVDAVPDDPIDVVEKLKLRLEKYQVVLKAAEDEEGAGAKIRRYKRIIAQYNTAISKASAGKDVDLSELPNPPGLPPLVAPGTPLPSPVPSPVPQRKQPSPAVDKKIQSVPSPSPPKKALTRIDKTVAILKDRQKEYRDAAVNAKRSGQIPEAKEFLKISKGFDRLILATESGLPVDLSTIPVSLNALEKEDHAFELISEKDFADTADCDVYEMLKHELQEQIKSCMTRRAQFKDMGDVANANRFEQQALSFKKDLNKVLMYQTSGHPIPKFHYEQKSFPIVHCFSDIAAGELELSIVQAVSLAKPCDTYVGYEFPYPSDAAPSGYSPVIKNSVNPIFNFAVKFDIDRDSKPCQRVFKRHGIKLELWSRGGFLRKDVSLGTAVVKLLPLTTDIIIHDAFDLMNGRRPAGGKLEVKLRVREPILAKKLETITEKWLILD